MTTIIEYIQDAGGWFARVFSKGNNKIIFLELVNDKLLEKLTKFIMLMEDRDPVVFAEWCPRTRLQTLYHAFIDPLQPYLPAPGNEERLVLAPSGVLHQLPLNAAQNPKTKRYLTQDYTVIFTPSLTILRKTLNLARQARWQPTTIERVLYIAYSGQRHLAEEYCLCLEKIEKSVNEMLKMFPDVKTLIEKDATIKGVATNAVDRELVHVFCHGMFNPNTAEKSGLLLYDDEFLTGSRIMSNFDLSQAHLTILAACQSGRTTGNEPFSLIKALLSVKSKAVVATLWKVNEDSMHTFFHHFYHAIKEGDLPAYALSNAAEKMRQTKGLEHPYYWAAFQVSGLAYGMPPT